MAEPSPITTPPIEGLPSELVAHIAVLSVWGPDYSSSLKAFSALSRTSSHFYRILNPLLYQHNFRHDQPYQSCVLWAVEHGNIDTLKRARSYGADLNIDGSRDESDFTIPLRSLPGRYIATALHLSIRYGHMDIFNYLLDENVDIEVPSRGLCLCMVGGDPKTYPLHGALSHSTNPRFAQELIAKGAYRVAEQVPAIAYMENMEAHSKPIESLLQRSEPLAMGASLQYAVRNKRSDLVRELLEKGADVTYRNPASGETALHVALDDHGQDAGLEVLKLLLAHPEAPLAITDNYGALPIHSCTSKPALVEAMKLLLAHPNIEPLASDRTGATAFDIAAKSDSAPMFSLLVRHPAVSPYDEDQWPGDKPLHLALKCIVDSLDIVKFLLAQPEAHVSLPGLDMKTPLHICAANEALIEHAKLLLAHPTCSIEHPQNDMDISGNTPLLYAVRSGFIPMMELILSQPDIDVSTADETGQTPLHVCASIPALFEIAQRILAHPSIKPSRGDEFGATPLFYAAKSGYLPMIKLLLTQPGINVSEANNVGKTPLHVCAANPELLEATKLLLAHPDIQTTVMDRDDMPPLAFAVESGSIAMFDLIANRPEVDISSLFDDGRNALHLVCSSEETEDSKRLVEDLLDRGVPINDGRETWGSPLYCAMEKRNFEIALMLLSRGADPKLEIDARHRWGPLHHLLWKPHPRQTELLRELLAKGAEVNRQTVDRGNIYHDTIDFDFGGTPLAFALFGANNVECMKLLLKAGARARAMSGSADQGKRQSIIATLFQAFVDDATAEEDVENIKEGVVLLLRRATDIGRFGEGATALELASDAAHYAENWALLNLLMEHATILNIDPDYVQELSEDYEPEAVEIKAALARFKKKLLAEPI
ncbi:unnamed protein product [Clonostachys chloroleuca]|uniref:Uncharacterized protein n=1 Tax=Clonostachys chloroleuca TaxID=1926264 RepID=A0AA35Q375_9HYPO|nr:unnamed protein product [Clonostachys chloroleuca]